MHACCRGGQLRCAVGRFRGPGCGRGERDRGAPAHEHVSRESAAEFCVGGCGGRVACAQSDDPGSRKREGECAEFAYQRAGDGEVEVEDGFVGYEGLVGGLVHGDECEVFEGKGGEVVGAGWYG